jgi:hypothetical protein
VLLPVLLYAAILVVAARLVYSKSGIVVLGLGTVILLDRYIFALLPWKRPVAWRRELAVRLVYFAVGALGFYLTHLAAIKIEELVMLGTALSLADLVFESAFGGAVRLLALLRLRLQVLCRRWLRAASGHGLFFGAVALGIPAFCLPLAPHRRDGNAGLHWSGVPGSHIRDQRRSGPERLAGTAQGGASQCHFLPRARKQPRPGNASVAHTA